jgi:alpha/beta superfamily hydrolase
MQLFRVVLAALVLATSVGMAAGASEGLEESVCGSFQEPFAFWIWSRTAGKPNPEAASRIPNAEAIVHRTKDGRLLSGYKLGTTAPGGAVVGSVLVAQGNAMLADQLLSTLTIFSNLGIEAYVFDYRGYGASEGQRRLKAIVSDYREIYDSFVAASRGKRLLYGISFGGIVLLNVVRSGITFDRAAIDSTPSRVSNFGCPEKYDPVSNLPKDASRFLFVAGAQDEVVPLRDSQELIELARARGGQIEVRPDYGHASMDADLAVRGERLELIRSFLTATDHR